MKESNNYDREKLRETALYGKMTFPYTVYHARIPEWLSDFPLHWHDEFEIILVTFGRVVFTVNGSRYVAQKDGMILISSGAVHSIERKGSDYSEYFNIIFSFSLLEENTDSHCSREFLSRLSDGAVLKNYHVEKDTPLCRALCPLAKDLVSHRNENYSGYELMIKSRLFEMLYIIINQNLVEAERKNQSERDKTSRERLRKILSYTATHFSESISVEAARLLFAIVLAVV